MLIDPLALGFLSGDGISPFRTKLGIGLKTIKGVINLGTDNNLVW